MALLSGKVIVITGASSGVGRAMANALAEQGVILILAARDEEALEETAKECRELGGVSYAIPTDTRNAADVEHLAMTATALTGELFAWINNAGVMAIGALDQVPAEINEEVIRTNLLGYINGAQVAIPIFKRQRHGIIINNISVGGWLPTPYATAYSASKFGLRGFSETLPGHLHCRSLSQFSGHTRPAARSQLHWQGNQASTPAFRPANSRQCSSAASRQSKTSKNHRVSHIRPATILLALPCVYAEYNRICYPNLPQTVTGHRTDFRKRPHTGGLRHQH